MSFHARLRHLALATFVVGGAAQAALAADDPASFYQGRNVSFVVGFNTGGGADAYARLVARHLGRHIPGNPTIVVRNMQGAGSILAANHIFNLSPKDGSEIGLFAGNIAIDPVIGGVPAKYDSREFTWIGNPAAEVDVCIARPEKGFKSFDTLFAREMVTGTAGTATWDFPVALNSILKTKFKLVKGYNGSNALKLALERDEIDGYCGVGWDALRAGGLTRDKVDVLLQFTASRDPDLPDVPAVMELARNPQERQLMTLIFGWVAMSRPIAAPPGIPPERAKALRDAFDATMKDPALLADSEREMLPVQPMSGAEITRFVQEVYRTPKDVAAKAAVILGRTEH